MSKVKRLNNSAAGEDQKRFDALIAYFKKYGEQYKFDPLMLAAQGYQPRGIRIAVLVKREINKGVAEHAEEIPCGSSPAGRSTRVKSVRKISGSDQGSVKHGMSGDSIIAIRNGREKVMSGGGRRLIWALGASVVVLAACGDGTQGSNSTVTTTNPDECSPIDITISQGDGQTGTVGTELGSRPSIQATCTEDRITKAVRGLRVVWSVTVGHGGKVTPETTTNDAGIASAAWVVGSAAGPQELKADFWYGAFQVANSVYFRATATAPPAAPAPRPCDAAGGTNHGFATVITTNEVWTAETSPHRGGSVQVSGALLTIKPGAIVCVDRLQFTNEARLSAQGTAALPIVFTAPSATSLWTGLIFDPPTVNMVPAAPGALEFVLVENAKTVTITHPMSVSDVTFRKTLSAAAGYAQIYMTMTDAAPRLERVVVDGFGSTTDPASGTSNPAVLLSVVPRDPFAAPPTFELSLKVVHSPGDGLVLSAAGNTIVSLASCEFSGNGGNGLVARGDTRHVTVTGCNFINNVLAGVRYDENVYSVVATGNWWGDPAGAAAGDGVFGNIDASLALPQPVVLGY